MRLLDDVNKYITDEMIANKRSETSSNKLIWIQTHNVPSDSLRAFQLLTPLINVYLRTCYTL
jgi:hypothetical protein